mmetsp:Transcript_17956/g.29009  ORF Transcript_17956/g.29009 Transcript_17956/m.29009 type:complete len:161 (+) Transcript_17956:63-545(+)
MDADADDSNKLFPLLLLQSIFLPAQGFFNVLIFIRPQYMRSRKDFPQESRWWCVRRALYGQVVKPKRTRSMVPTANANSVGGGNVASHELGLSRENIAPSGTISGDLTETGDHVHILKPMPECEDTCEVEEQMIHSKGDPKIGDNSSENNKMNVNQGEET